MEYQILLLSALIILSGFFSSTEIAYILSNKIKLEIKAKKNFFGANSAKFFYKHPEKFFSTILIGNNIVNISFASLFAFIAQSYFKWNEYEILFYSTVLLLICGELLPKYIAAEAPDAFIYALTPFAKTFYYAAFPIIRLPEIFSKTFVSIFSNAETKTNKLFDIRQFKELIEEATEKIGGDKNEKKILSNILEIKDQKVYEAMRPRTEIVAVEINADIKKVAEVFAESGFSKLPVYEKDLDNIKGMIIAYDLFKYPKDVNSILREILFVPETKKSIDMLNEFLSKGVSIAIVVDEFGGTAGLITVEDIIEELFGEIKDEYDVDEEICKKIDEKNYIVSAKVEIDQINEKFNLDLPIGEYETIGGMLAYYSGRILSQGESIKISKYSFYVVKAAPKRVELCKIAILDEL